MLRLYYYLNKTYLKKILFFHVVFLGIMFLSRFFGLTQYDLILTILCGIVFIFFASIVLAIANNKYYYQENIYWILSLPLSLKRILFSHILFNFAQILENFILCWISFKLALSFSTLRHTTVETIVNALNNFSHELADKGVLYDFFLNFSYVNALMLLFFIVLMMLLFAVTGVLEGLKKFQENYEVFFVGSKKILFWSGVIIFHLGVFKLLYSGLIISSWILAYFSLMLIMICLGTFNLNIKILRNKWPFALIYGGLWAFFFVGFFAMANYRINSMNLNPINLISELNFLGPKFATFQDSKIKRILMSPDFKANKEELENLADFKKPFRRVFDQLNYKEKLNAIMNKNGLSSSLFVYRLVPSGFFSLKDKITILNHVVKTSDVEPNVNELKSFFDDIQMSLGSLKQFLARDNQPMILHLGLKFSVFTHDPLPINQLIVDNLARFKGISPKKVLGFLSLINQRKVTYKEVYEDRFIVPHVTSFQDRCEMLLEGYRKDKKINDKDFPHYIWCSNQFFAEFWNTDKVYKLRPIFFYPERVDSLPGQSALQIINKNFKVAKTHLKR